MRNSKQKYLIQTEKIYFKTEISKRTRSEFNIVNRVIFYNRNDIFMII